MKALILLALALTGCTTIRDANGHKRFSSGDVKNLSATLGSDGSMTVSVESASPSAVIAAIGKAATPAVMAMGAVATMNATSKVVEKVRAPLLPR